MPKTLAEVSAVIRFELILRRRQYRPLRVEYQIELESRAAMSIS
jgi:hypothetical protein